jgi:hypothetical protein
MRVLIVSDVTGYMPGGVPAETRSSCAAWPHAVTR